MKVLGAIKEYLYLVVKGTRRGVGAFIVKVILSFLSVIYFLLIELRNALYEMNIIRAHSLPRPVVSVGNITVGGTGKTPLVEALVKRLVQKGIRPCVLIRGYGGDEDKILKENINPLLGRCLITSKSISPLLFCWVFWVLSRLLQMARCRL